MSIMLFRTASLRLARTHERAGGSRSGRHELDLITVLA